MGNECMDMSAALPSSLHPVQRLAPKPMGQQLLERTEDLPPQTCCRTLITSPWSNTNGAPLGSSVNAQGRRIEYGTPLERTTSSPFSFHVRMLPSSSFNLTAGGSFSLSMPGRSTRVKPAALRRTSRGVCAHEGECVENSRPGKD